MDTGLILQGHATLAPESISDICQAIWIVAYTYFGFIAVGLALFVVYTFVNRNRQ